MHDEPPTQPSFPGEGVPHQPQGEPAPAMPYGDYQAPPIPPIPPAPPSRPRGRGFWGRPRNRWLVAGGAALVLLLAIAGGVAFAAHQSSPATSVVTTPTTSTNIPVGPQKNAVYTVVAVNGTAINATRSGGGSVTITTTPKTTITRGGQPASLSDLSAGTKFHVRGKTQSDGQITAQRIEIVLPEAKGTIMGISGDTLTIQTRKKTITVQITSSTMIVDAATHAPTTVSSLTVGETVTIQGLPNGDGTFTALRIAVGTPSKAPAATPAATGTPSE